MPIEYLKCHGLGISRESIWESSGNRKVYEVDREAALSCQLRYGSSEQKPLVSLLLGVVLMSPLILLVRQATVLWEIQDAAVNPRYEAAMLFAVTIGGWLVYQALFRKQYYVAVTTRDKIVRLSFQRTAALADIRGFLREAETKYGWTVQEGLVHAA